MKMQLLKKMVDEATDMLQMGNLQDQARAMATLRWMSEQGNPKAQYNYALALIGYENKVEEALFWARQAAEQGFVDAMGLCGEQLLISDSPDAHLEGFRWVKKAAEKGDALSMYTYAMELLHGTVVPSQPKIGLRWLRRAAEKGCAEAQCELGEAYSSANYGLPLDMRASAKWYCKAADQKYPKACVHVGAMYAAGDCGVKQNFDKALEYLLPYADLFGEGVAYVVAKIYEGKGDSPENNAELERWLLRGAEDEHYESVCSLGELYLYGCQGIKPNVRKANKWLRLACKMGDADAAFNLGVSYVRGLGLKKNLEKGEHYIRLAHERGHEKAGEILKMIDKE